MGPKMTSRSAPVLCKGDLDVSRSPHPGHPQTIVDPDPLFAGAGCVRLPGTSSIALRNFFALGLVLEWISKAIGRPVRAVAAADAPLQEQAVSRQSNRTLFFSDRHMGDHISGLVWLLPVPGGAIRTKSCPSAAAHGRGRSCDESAASGMTRCFVSYLTFDVALTREGPVATTWALEGGSRGYRSDGAQPCSGEAGPSGPYTISFHHQIFLRREKVDNVSISLTTSNPGNLCAPARRYHFEKPAEHRFAACHRCGNGPSTAAATGRNPSSGNSQQCGVEFGPYIN